jgi:hypothetical protein
MCVQIDEPRRDDEPGAVDDPRAACHLHFPDRDNLVSRDRDVAHVTRFPGPVVDGRVFDNNVGGDRIGAKGQQKKQGVHGSFVGSASESRPTLQDGRSRCTRKAEPFIAAVE